MHRFLCRLGCCLSVSLCLAIFSSHAGAADSPAPKKIVLGIADGTSKELYTLSRLYHHGAGGRLALDTFDRSAFVATFSADDLVTDSAAAATAMARGEKVDNNALGWGKNGALKGPTILDLARQAGWLTAVVTDDKITGATPAAFVVEQRRRFQEAEIAEKLSMQLQKGGRVDVLFGGGSMYFVDRGEASASESDYPHVKRTAQNLAEAGVTTHTDWETFSALLAGQPRLLDKGPVAGFFFEETAPYVAQVPSRSPRLIEMVQAAVKLLEAQEKPWLLVFEGALPDKACHKNLGQAAVVEFLEFDSTMGWLKTNLGPDALVMATTDHANGGITLNGVGVPRFTKGNALLGPDAENGLPRVTFATGPGGKSHVNEYNRTLVGDDGVKTETVQRDPADPAYVTPALVPLSDAAHSGGDVWLAAHGPGSDRVKGFIDNTDIFKIIEAALADAKKQQLKP